MAALDQTKSSQFSSTFGVLNCCPPEEERRQNLLEVMKLQYCHLYSYLH